MIRWKSVTVLFFAIGFLFLSCELFEDIFNYGQLGGADQTGSYMPDDPVMPGGTVTAFEERLSFLSGVWYSHYAGIGRLDGYRIRRWSDITAKDKAKIKSLFPKVAIDNPKTYYEGDEPQFGDYVLFYDDTVYGQQDDDTSATDGNWGFAYFGLVRAINIFNGDKNRGAIIIEYFEECDPNWLWDPGGYNGGQALERGEKPFFGIYYKVLSPDVVQMANAVDLEALYSGRHYYTEKETLDEAIEFNSVENEAELIAWGVVIPQDRE